MASAMQGAHACTDPLLEKHLGTGERLIWCGAPSAGLRLQRGDIFVIPFSLLWAGFAVFWEYQAFAWNAPAWLKALGLAFIAAGCYMIFGRYILDMRRRRQTRYGLSNERVLILAGNQLTEVNLRALSEISLSDGKKPLGTIRLVWSSQSTDAGVESARLELVANPREVWERILVAQQDAKSALL